MVFKMIEKEVGNKDSNFSFSSEYNRTSISPMFKSTVGDGLIQLSNPSGNILRGEFLIEVDKIPNKKNNYTFSAYIKSALTPPEDLMLFEDLVEMNYEDNNFMKYE
jgi:hypothetical protein